MKMGQIKWVADAEEMVHGGHFQMMTPSGLRDVTLRCTINGVVEVEEVVRENGMSIEALVTSMSQVPVENATTRALGKAADHLQRPDART